MGLVLLEENEFLEKVEQLLTRLLAARLVREDKWISDKEAMHLLRIKSKTTLQQYRDQGKVRFSQPQKKIILYDRQSILDFLEENARNTF